jgi:hypothetical protein
VAESLPGASAIGEGARSAGRSLHEGDAANVSAETLARALTGNRHAGSRSATGSIASPSRRRNTVSISSRQAEGRSAARAGRSRPRGGVPVSGQRSRVRRLEPVAMRTGAAADP